MKRESNMIAILSFFLTINFGCGVWLGNPNEEGDMPGGEADPTDNGTLTYESGGDPRSGEDLGNPLISILKPKENQNPNPDGSDVIVPPNEVHGSFLTASNSEIRCDFSQLSLNRYSVSCQAVILENGEEKIPVGLSEKTKIEWQVPTIKSGEGTIENCLIESSKLSIKCTVKSEKEENNINIGFTVSDEEMTVQRNQDVVDLQPTPEKNALELFASSPRNTVQDAVEPFKMPFTVPGSWSAVDFDKGGEGISWHDIKKGNQGKHYRENTDVDIYQNVNGNYRLGEVRNGEWVTYTISVQQAANYQFKVKSSSPFDHGSLELYIFNTSGLLMSRSTTIPKTDSWESFQTTSISDIPLKEGKHFVRLFFNTTGDFVGDFLTFGFVAESLPENAEPPKIAPTVESQEEPPNFKPFFDNPVEIPASIEAEHFDKGEGGSYDRTKGNAGNDFRQDTDVDIYENKLEGHRLGQIYNGEWVQYSIEVLEPRDYEFSLRLSSKVDGGKVNVYVNGVMVVVNAEVPNTRGWQRFRKVLMGKISFIKSGVYQVKVEFLTDDKFVADIDKVYFE